ncbi:hypothetical protein HN51_064986 [Arachis hypogaea]
MRQGDMGSESWADVWGAGGIGAMENDDAIGSRSQNDMDTGANNTKKSTKGGGGFTKVKAVAMIGVLKIKSGTLICVNWIKIQLKRKTTSK